MTFVTMKVYRSSRNFYYLRGSLNADIRVMLVRSLCAMHLDYCASVFSSLNARISSMPKVALNAWIRLIKNVSRFSSMSSHRLILEFLSCENRWQYFVLVMFYKVTVMRFLPLLSKTLSHEPETTHRRGRSTNSFKFRVLQYKFRKFVHSIIGLSRHCLVFFFFDISVIFNSLIFWFFRALLNECFLDMLQ